MCPVVHSVVPSAMHYVVCPVVHCVVPSAVHSEVCCGVCCDGSVFILKVYMHRVHEIAPVCNKK